MTTRQHELQELRAGTARLQGELAEEAKHYLALLERAERGEDVAAELFGSTTHLGAHASLLADRMTEEAILADQAEVERKI